MKNKVLYYSLVSVIIINMPCVGAVRAVNNNDPAPVKKLKLHRAPEPREALKYQLLLGILDQTNGNAALHYYRASNMLPTHTEIEEIRDNISDWLDFPIDQLPRKEIESAISHYRSSLHLVDLAVKCDKCDWDLPIEDGYSMLLPGLSDFRDIAKVIALQARLQIADGKYNEAIDTLKKGFVMSRHIADGPTLIQDLVGISISAFLLNDIEQFVQQPDTPNLYWALTAMPQPFIDMRQAMQYEKDALYTEFPQLKDIETAKLTPLEVSELLSAFMRVMEDIGVDVAGNKFLSVGWVMLHYQDAKRFLAEHGRSKAQIEAMPAGQSVLIYQLQQYKQIRDDIFKWFNVPYRRAYEGMKKAEQQLKEKMGNSLRANIFTALLPAISKAYLMTARLDRHIAMLRCVEAVRMYGADHDGKLPGSLDEIKQVPIPLDPVTGKSFIYEVTDGKAVFEAPVSPSGKSKRRPRYELTICPKVEQ